jgi:hypothetical protein
MPKLPNCNLWNFRTRNFRTRNSGTSGPKPHELLNQKLRNFSTTRSGTSEPEALELPNQKLRNFQTRFSGTSVPAAPELPDQNLQKFLNFQTGTSSQEGLFFYRESIRKRDGSNIISIILIDNSLLIGRFLKETKDDYTRKLLTAQVLTALKINAVLNWCLQSKKQKSLLLLVSEDNSKSKKWIL